MNNYDREKMAACETASKQAAAAVNECCAVATREQTVGELLDQRIRETARVVEALRDLKASLPGSFLSSGASRIAALSGVR